MTDTLSPSAELLAAQRRLLALRRELKGETAVSRPSSPDPTSTATATTTLKVSSYELPAGLPAHLGWDSAAVTAVLRHSLAQPDDDDPAALPICSTTTTAVPSSPCTNAPPPYLPLHEQSVPIYPDLAMGMLRQEQTAPGRIWLLLRHLDTAGQGWVSVASARETLTRKESPLRVCGWRQLRNLLNQGENIFWKRDDGRIWLRSVAKVSAALEIWHLSYRRVALPITVLTQSIGDVRAHLYASWHSGRTPETGDHPSGKSNPIARATLTQLSSLSDRTQRSYEQRAQVKAQANIALGPVATAVAAEEMAWQQGNAAFHFVDKKGKQGPAGATYIAWQLPNSYAGPHQRLTRGRQKTINRQLADLFMQGITGNDQEKIEQHFFADAKSAVRKASAKKDDVYWRSRYNHIWYYLSS